MDGWQILKLTASGYPGAILRLPIIVSPQVCLPSRGPSWPAAWRWRLPRRLCLPNHGADWSQLGYSLGPLQSQDVSICMFVLCVFVFVVVFVFVAVFVFPTMGQIGLNLVTVLDHFRVKMWVSVCVWCVCMFVILCICGCLCPPQHSLDWSQFGHCPGSLQSINVRMYSCVCVFFVYRCHCFSDCGVTLSHFVFCLVTTRIPMNKWPKRGRAQVFSNTAVHPIPLVSKVDN